MKKRIILDTNFLLIPGQFKVDIFSEMKRICNFSYEPAVLPEIKTELEKLSEGLSKDSFAAKLGLQLLSANRVKMLKNNRKLFKRADEAIVEIASIDTYVATQDKVLRQKLKGKIAGIIGLRQKQYLEIFG